MSRMRSWVIGRGVVTPWRAKAMAVASGAPMKIGSVRLAPSVSWSRTTGVFDWRSTRTAAKCTSTMPENLAWEELFDMRIRLYPERGQVAGHHPVQVAVALGVVEPVAEDELVLD